jgi:RNA polymerase sigma-70 factor (ECF subfamily)
MKRRKPGRMAVAQSLQHTYRSADAEPAAFDAARFAPGFSWQVSPSYGKRVTTPGDSQASLSAEFVRIRASLERYLRSRGAGDRAEDLVQELWLKLAASPVVADVTDPSSYLFRMAHNLMLDRRRTEFRRTARERLYVDWDEGTSTGIDPAPPADRALEAKHALEAVDRVLHDLGERTNYIFRRHRVDGIGQRDIAIELGITLSGVEKHLQKAYKAVYAITRQGGDDEPV